MVWPENSMRHRIDLNCDLGEGAGQDAELMPLITSANIVALFDKYKVIYARQGVPQVG